MNRVTRRVYSEQMEAYIMEEVIWTTYDICLMLSFYLFHQTDLCICLPVVNKVRRLI